jgi:hypothetical protein
MIFYFNDILYRHTNFAQYISSIIRTVAYSHHKYIYIGISLQIKVESCHLSLTIYVWYKLNTIKQKKILIRSTIKKTFQKYDFHKYIFRWCFHCSQIKLNIKNFLKRTNLCYESLFKIWLKYKVHNSTKSMILHLFSCRLLWTWMHKHIL